MRTYGALALLAGLASGLGCETPGRAPREGPAGEPDGVLDPAAGLPASPGPGENPPPAPGEVAERAAEFRSVPLPLSTYRKVELRGFDGPLQISAVASEAPRLLCHLGTFARTREAAVEALREIEVECDGEADWLVVRVRKPPGDAPSATRTSYDLFLPPEIRLRISSSAGVTIRGPLGPCQVDVGFGDVRLSGVRGRVSATVGTGNVFLGDVAAESVFGNALHGDVRMVGIRAPSLVARSGSGGIEIDGAEVGLAEAECAGSLRITGLAGRLQGKTSVGRITLERSSGEALSLSTSHGDVEAVGVRGTLSIQAPRGSVRVRDFEGGLAAGTQSGDLEVEGRFRSLDLQGENSHLRARVLRGAQPEGPWTLATRRGDVVFEVPPDFGCRLQASSRFGEVEPEVALVVEAGRAFSGDRIEGTLNGGGERVVLATRAGNVAIRHSSGSPPR